MLRAIKGQRPPMRAEVVEKIVAAHVSHRYVFTATTAGVVQKD
jgi:hypothetical protein